MSLPATDALAAATVLTPAGIQSAAMLTRRRALAGVLNIGTYLALATLLAAALGAGGWTFIDAAIMACFLIAAPWSVLGFWNAMMGLWLLHGPAERTALERVAPYAAAGERLTALTSPHRCADDDAQRRSGAGLPASCHGKSQP